MAVYGKIDEFNIEDDSWSDYMERLEHYFYANDIEDGKKKAAIFLTVVGSKTYGLLKSLLAPEKVVGKSVEELNEVLKSHLCPIPIEIAERYKFYKRDQQEGETLKHYIANLRQLSETCNFEAFLEQALRDRYVCGLRDDSIRKRLLIEKELTLKKVLEISQCLDSAQTENRLFTKREIKVENSFNMQTELRRKNRRCYRCNDEKHLANTCRFKDAICNKCNTKGHIARACRGGTRKQIHEHQQNYTSMSDSRNTGQTEKETRANNAIASSDEEDNVYRIHKLSSREPYMISLTVKDTNVNFEIDTGSGLTLISEETYFQSFSKLDLLPSKSKLKSYTGEHIPIVGELHVNELVNLH